MVNQAAGGGPEDRLTLDVVMAGNVPEMPSVVPTVSEVFVDATPSPLPAEVRR
jgi:hypothetical protein